MSVHVSACVCSQWESVSDGSEDVMEVTDFWLVNVGASATGLSSSGASHTGSLRSGIEGQFKIY